LANAVLRREASARAAKQEQLEALKQKAAAAEQRTAQLMQDKQFLQSQVATYMKQIIALQESVKAARGELHELNAMHQLSADLTEQMAVLQGRVQDAKALSSKLQHERAQLLHDKRSLQQQNVALDTQLQQLQDQVDHMQRVAPAAAAPGVLRTILQLPADRPMDAQAVAAHPVFRFDGTIYGPTGRKQGEAVIKAVDILRYALEGVAADEQLRQCIYSGVVGGGYTEPGVPWSVLNKHLDDDWKGSGLEELLVVAVGDENAAVLCGTHKYAKVAAMLMLGLLLEADMVQCGHSVAYSEQQDAESSQCSEQLDIQSSQSLSGCGSEASDELYHTC
jgi:hypothetical protein